LYEEVLTLALKRENALRKGLSADEIRELIRMLKILMQNALQLGGMESEC